MKTILLWIIKICELALKEVEIFDKQIDMVGGKELTLIDYDYWRKK